MAKIEAEAKVKIEAEVWQSARDHVQKFADAIGLSVADIVRMSVFEYTGWKGGARINELNRSRKAKSAR